MVDSDETVSPRTVAIVALGPSASEYLKAAEGSGHKGLMFDEVWTINTMASVIKSDIVFHMDDIRVQMARAGGNPKIANLVEYLRGHQGRVITSRPHRDFPCMEAFPLEAVLNDLKTAYFNNTVAYAMAYAIHQRFDRICLYGCDYNYPGTSDVEPGRACLEYWIGRAIERGIEILIAPSSTLMDIRGQRLYGYDTLDVQMRVGENGYIEVQTTPRDGVIDPAEFEKRYDHRRKVA